MHVRAMCTKFCIYQFHLTPYRNQDTLFFVWRNHDDGNQGEFLDFCLVFGVG